MMYESKPNLQYRTFFIGMPTCEDRSVEEHAAGVCWRYAVEGV